MYEADRGKTDMDDENTEDMTRLVQLGFKMMHIGFDELPMDERMEFVRLGGNAMGSLIDGFYYRMNDLEERIESLESK